MRERDMSVGSITQYKKGKWRYSFYFMGERCLKAGFDTRSQANAAMSRHKKRLEALGDQFQERYFDEAYEEYLEDMKDENKPEWYKNKVTYGIYFNEHFREFYVDLITEFNVRSYIKKRKKTGKKVPAKGKRFGHRVSKKKLAPATIDKELAVLKHFFGWCVKNGHAYKNPAQYVEKENEDNRRDVRLKKEQIALAVDCAETRELKARFLLTFGWGFRHGEISNIPREKFDVINKKLYVKRNKKRKGKVVVTEIDLSDKPELFELLKSLPVSKKRKDFLFPHKTCKKSFKAALQKAGIIGNVVFHDLRHSAATYQNQQGRKITEIQKMLCHEDIKTTMRYIHVEDEEIDSMAMDALEGLI